MLIDRSAIVTLREIDPVLESIVIELRVSDQQSSYVAPNQRSLADAKGNPGAWSRIIYADQTPIGYVLLFMPFLPDAIERPQIGLDQIGLWRFMIDNRFQRMGYGRQVIQLVCT